MNDVVIHQPQGSQLAIHREQADWTDAQAQALFSMFNIGNASMETIQAYFHTCQTTGLDPFKRQIYLIERSGKWTPQTSIDGFRIIRDRSGVYDGDETEWCGDDNVWGDAWLGEGFPKAARVKLHVKGRKLPVIAVALWREYVQTKSGGGVTQMWATKSAHMLAKVAEALAIRKAFPDDTGGLYTDDEMMQASNGQDAVPRRERSPGIQDLLEPPVVQQAYQQPPAKDVGGGFMDAPQQGQPVPPVQDPNIEDAVLVPDHESETPPEQHDTAPMALAEPEVAPAPTPAPEAASLPGSVMDMEPEAAPPRVLDWSQRLVLLCEAQHPSLSALRALFDEAGAAGKLGEPVPWAGDGATLEGAIMTVKANLEAGQPAWT